MTLRAQDEIGLLVERLRQAEADLSVAAKGNLDAIIDARGQTYLLLEAQVALRRSEAAATEQAGFLRAILENTPDDICHLGSDGQIHYLNRPSVGRELPGKDWFTLVDPGSRAELRQIFDRVLSTGAPESFEGPGLNDAGSPAIYARRFGAVRRDGAVVGVVVTTRDVTSQKASEGQLVVADRMASVGTLAAGVAHEINNPLASVVSNLDLAISDLKALPTPCDVPPELTEELEDARLAAERVRVIVRDLQLFSRLDPEKHEPVDVERVLEMSLKLARHELRHHARLVREYSPLPMVDADASRLGQVFLNLIINAAQAMASGDPSTNVLRVRTWFDAGVVNITMSDSGPGILAAHRAQIFTPFFTTKPVGKGTGLGLSICHRLVTSFGGTLTFDSEPGKGSTFKVSLGVSARRATILPTPPVAASPVGRARVLIVDDDRLVATAASRILSSQHDIVITEDAEAALQMLRGGDAFDVVLCDLMMPKMSGMEFHAAVAAFAPDLADRFLFVTGGAFTEEAARFIGLIGERCLEKPFKVEVLRRAVNQMIGAKR